MDTFKSILCLLLVSCFKTGTLCQTVVPRYEINLDLPAEDRWRGILVPYVNYTPGLEAMLKAIIPAEVFPIAEEAALYLETGFDDPYRGELRGVAQALNLKLSEVVLLNIFYEITAFAPLCTSIVAQDDKGSIYHGRNLDYGKAEFLREVSFNLDFKKSGKIVYSGVTFLGYIGILTGQKPKAFTVSLDERDSGSVWENLLQLLLLKAKPVGFFLRSLLANDSIADFETALKHIEKVDLVAAAYIIVGGLKPGQGAVVTRARLIPVDLWKLNATEKRWFLVETNYDHWKAPPRSDDRRDPAIKAMKQVGQKNLNATTLFEVLSTKPVLNEETVYTTIMSAKSPEVFQTWKRKCCD